MSVRSSVAPQQIWTALVSPRRWPEWNDGVEWVALEGPLAPGSYATVKPKPGRQTAFRLEAVVVDRLLGAAVTLGPLAALSVTFTLAETADGGCTIAVIVATRGALGGLMRKRAERVAAALPIHLARLAGG